MRRKGRMVAIALLAVSTVVPVTLLSWRSHALSESHREVADSALEDYAALAANEFAQRLHRTLSREKVVAAFRPFEQFSGAFVDQRNLPSRVELFGGLRVEVDPAGPAASEIPAPAIGGEGAAERGPGRDRAAEGDGSSRGVTDPRLENEPKAEGGAEDSAVLGAAGVRDPGDRGPESVSLTDEEAKLAYPAYYLVRRYFFYKLDRDLMNFGAGAGAPLDPFQTDGGGVPSEAEQEWVQSILREYVVADHSYYGERGILFGELEGEQHAYMCALYSGPNSPTTTAVYGFELRLAMLRDLFQDCVDLGPILPGPLIQRVGDTHPATIVVRSSSGEALYQMAEPVAGSITASRSMGPAFGNLRVEASLRPDAFDQLLAGGVPPTRSPEIWALLGSSLVLLGLTVALMRRELILARLRSDFVASVSHELRTPLTQIRLFADTLILGRCRTDDERDRSLKVIDRESRRLDHLLENVLQFSRSERKEVNLDRVPRPLRPLIEEVLQSFGPIAEARRVKVAAQLSDVATVEIDADAFRRILLNLLDNAVKYGPTGQTVTVGLVQSEGVARMWVDDEGEGVAPENLPRLWEKYWRAHSAESSGVAGTGIGLAVVRELVVRHGGRVLVETNSAGGARFVVEIPVLQEGVTT